MIAPPFSLHGFEDWAEDTFQQSGTGHGVTINSPRRDRRGWDFLVEWDEPSKEGLARDRQRLARVARVQVKSCRQTKPAVRIKLTNALRFAEAAEPCFVVLYWLNRARTGVEIFARPFDAELIKATLRRSREAEREGRTDTHKIHIVIKLGCEDLHTTDLIPWIKAECQDDPSDYHRMKAAYHERVGYEPARYIGRLHLDADLDKLIAQALGLEQLLDARWLELTEIRFGLPHMQPDFAGKPDSVDLRTIPRKATVKFVTDDGQTCAFAGEFRSFKMLHDELPDRLFASFISPFVRLKFYRDGGLGLSIELPHGATAPANSLKQAVSLMTLIAAGDTTLRLRVSGMKKQEARIPQQPPSENIDFYLWANQRLESVLLMPKAGEKLYLCLEDLVPISDSLDAFWSAIVTLGLTLRIEAKPGAPHVPLSGLISFVTIEMGGYLLAAFIRYPVLRLGNGDPAIRVELGHGQLIERWCKRGTLEEHEANLRRRFDRLFRNGEMHSFCFEDGSLIPDPNALPAMLIKTPHGTLRIGGKAAGQEYEGSDPI